jgi:hypothetical protein
VEGIVNAPGTAGAGGVMRSLGAAATAPGRSRADIARHYSQRVDLADLLPINKDLSSDRRQYARPRRKVRSR